jgi:murein L,D-transpeptidase YcbB/YkuD
MRRNTTWAGLAAIAALNLQACSLLSPTEEVRVVTPPPLPPVLAATAPLLLPEPKDAKFLQAMTKEQEALFTSCGEKWPCERVHYHRGLLALYEDRLQAAKHFQKVIAAAPRSRLASTSATWLQIIQDPRLAAERDGPYAAATDRLIRDLLDRELAIHQAARAKDQTASSLQELHEAIAQRDKKLKQLTAQMEALKQIDQELKDKARPR